MKKQSVVMTTAWQLFKAGRYASFRLALTASWAIETFRKKLEAGQVEFTFVKSTGEVRQAIGTRNPELIPSEFAPKGAKDIAMNIPFFDLEKNSWRSFSRASLVTI